MTALASPLTLLVRKLAQQATLDADDAAAILALPCRVRTLEPSSYLIREADTPAVCAVLLSGFAYRQKTGGDGARQILSLHIPGEPLDFQHLFLKVADHNVQTLSRAEVAFIDRRNIQDLMAKRPRVAHAIMVNILVEASIFREWILNIGRRDARGRLAHLLCEFAVRMQAMDIPDLRRDDLPITQEQLADALGLTPVHVNRTLRLLEREGLITRSKRNVGFPSWERLRDVADFNGRYLHLDGLQGPA